MGNSETTLIILTCDKNNKKSKDELIKRFSANLTKRDCVLEKIYEGDDEQIVSTIRRLVDLAK